MKTLQLSNLLWENVINPIPQTIIYRKTCADNIATEIEIDAENFVKLMEHFNSCGLNKITKAECAQLSMLYSNIYNSNNTKP